MAVYTTIDDSSLFRSTTLYTGDASAGRSLITGTFAPDVCWFKSRSAVGNHHIYGIRQGIQKFITVNSNSAQGSNGGTDGITAFNSTGVTMGGNTATNENTTTFVVWSWLANGTGSANTDGSISSTVSVNSTSKMSVVTFTGNGTSGTIGHGLGVKPDLIITKNLSAVGDMSTYCESLGATKVLYLDMTNAVGTTSSPWNDVEPTSSLFTVGGGAYTNGSGNTIIAYCFANVAGYSKVGGSYVGNGNADGTFVYTGFKPAYVICKKTDTEDWGIWGFYPAYNLIDRFLYTNQSFAESTGISPGDFLSNGFKIRTTDGKFNGSGATYIYLAFGETFVNSSGVPCNAR